MLKPDKKLLQLSTQKSKSDDTVTISQDPEDAFSRELEIFTNEAGLAIQFFYAFVTINADL